MLNIAVRTISSRPYNVLDRGRIKLYRLATGYLLSISSLENNIRTCFKFKCS